LLSALKSTASATLLAPSVTFVENIWRQFTPRMNDRQELRDMRIAVLVFSACVCAYAIAMQGTSIYELVSGAYQIPLVGAFVPLVAGLFWKRATTQGAVFAIVLVVYAIASVAWLILILRGPIRWWYMWASTSVDVLMVVILCIASGSATKSLLPIFFLLPISVAFLDSPLITAALGLSASFGYLLAWIVYANRDEAMGHVPPVVYVQVGCLLWLTAAITALSFTLARRAARVQLLLDVRRRLVVESMRSEERQNRELSELLHDGPLQNLLAVRLDLDDLRDNPTPEGFDRLDAALRDTVTTLRTTVSTLHPQVLAQVGLTAAVQELVAKYQQRHSAEFTTDLEDVGRPAAQALLYRSARELLANAHKHSRARHVTVTLHRSGSSTVLKVTDDGIGFDTSILAARVAEGHIGLASLINGIEAAGGSIEFHPNPGGGAVITVTVPDEIGPDEIGRQR
jgi:two-component system NarL family sensor kinase